MSDELEPRQELASAANSVRRMLERERAGGGGELVGASIAAARRARADAGAVVGTAPPVAEGASIDVESDRKVAVETVSAAVVDSEAARLVQAGSDSLFESLTAPAGGPRGTETLNPRDPGARAAIDVASRPVLDAIATEVRACQKCALWQTRTKAVPGVGSAISGIAFVGEGPGADEDRLGEPFVGRAGQLLDKIIEAMDSAKLIPGVPLNRKTVFIGNIIHCRPPENRVPLPVEIEQSSPFLLRQLTALKPRVICCLGKTAAEALLGEKGSLGSMRGRVQRFMGAKLIVTYHPAACLRNPAYKRPVWEDMQLLAREYLQD
jgi:DNA polymerase